jgi:pilus assembly protein CpaB
MKQKNVILMVVAVGCGLVAAFLTSQMSGKTVEQVDVVVATKDLPVGTVFTKDELKNLVVMKKAPKDGLPPNYIVNPEELLEKRLSRPMRAGETLNPQDLNKGIALPEGHDLVSLSIGPSQAASGFIVPGCRVDVMASLRLGNTLKVFELLVNTLVLNVNHDMTNNKNGVYPDINQVGFALTRKQAVLLELARARGCTITLKLRNEKRTVDEDSKYNLDETIKLLEGPQDPIVVKTGEDRKPETKPEVPPVPAGPESAPAPTIAVIKVLVATREIAPNTLITRDLIQEAFEWKELPKDFASDAVIDFREVVGNKAFKTGVSKNQWVTYEMLGLQAPKPTPQDTFVPQKPNPADPTLVQPVAPVAPPVVKRKFVDVAVHTASGTIIHRYEELPTGQRKKVGELTPEQAAQADRLEAQKAGADGRKN